MCRNRIKFFSLVGEAREGGTGAKAADPALRVRPEGDSVPLQLQATDVRAQATDESHQGVLREVKVKSRGRKKV